MPKVIWFALGAVAGMVYASRLIEKENLDKPAGMTPQETPEPKPDNRLKMAAMIEARSAQLGQMVQLRGAMLADKLRSQTIPQERFVTEPSGSPYGHPADLDVREAAAVGATYQPELGLESNR